MDRSDLAVLFKDELVATSQRQLFNLITIDLGGEVGQSCIVDNEYDIIYDSVIYSGYPCKFNGLGSSSTGETVTATLVVANPERIFQAYLSILKKKKVTIKHVFSNFLDYTYSIDIDGTVTSSVNPGKDTSAYIENVYLIDSYMSKDSSITLNLCATADLDIKLPRGRFNARACRFDYKDPNTCGYAGGLTSCRKDLADCIAHNNETYFGGFPGVPDGLRRLRL